MIHFNLRIFLLDLLFSSKNGLISSDILTLYFIGLNRRVLVTGEIFMNRLKATTLVTE